MWSAEVLSSTILAQDFLWVLKLSLAFYCRVRSIGHVICDYCPYDTCPQAATKWKKWCIWQLESWINHPPCLNTHGKYSKVSLKIAAYVIGAIFKMLFFCNVPFVLCDKVSSHPPLLPVKTVSLFSRLLFSFVYMGGDIKNCRGRPLITNSVPAFFICYKRMQSMYNRQTIISCLVVNNDIKILIQRTHTSWQTFVTHIMHSYIPKSSRKRGGYSTQEELRCNVSIMINNYFWAH